jgi:hypothetical protein
MFKGEYIRKFWKMKFCKERTVLKDIKIYYEICQFNITQCFGIYKKPKQAPKDYKM